MKIIEDLKNKIPNKETRFKEEGILNIIIKEYKKYIAEYDGCIIPKNIVLTVNQTEDFKNKTIPNIMNFHDRVCKAVKKVEDELDTWYDIENKERKRFIKILSAMQTIEDISLEIKEIMEQVVKNVKTDSKSIQILVPDILRLMEIFELNDVCIDKGHELLRYWGELLSIAKSYKDEETCKIIQDKVKQMTICLSKLDFTSIRKQISVIEEVLENKYRNTETLRIYI